MTSVDVSVSFLDVDVPSQLWRPGMLGLRPSPVALQFGEYFPVLLLLLLLPLVLLLLPPPPRGLESSLRGWEGPTVVEKRPAWLESPLV